MVTSHVTGVRVVAIAVLVSGLCAVTTTTASSDDLAPVSDLPWIHASWPFGCSYHCDCANGPDNADCSGVDVNLDSGTVVLASGGGTLAVEGRREGGLGPEYVEIDHTGVFMDYAHLTQRFWRNQVGVNLCNLVAIGYSGGSNGVDHLHYAGRSIQLGEVGSAQDNKSWAPIHGDQVANVTWNGWTSDGRPHSYAQSDWESGHWLAAREHAGGTTDAYTVDDSQDGHSPSVPQEFFLYGGVRTPDGWRDQEYGFSYEGSDAAHSWTRILPADAYYLATWDPILRATGSWAVYVFIPDHGATAPAARYQVHYLQNAGTGGWVWDEYVINQSSYSNEWVRLGEDVTYPTAREGQWKLSVKLMPTCDNCDDQSLGADAALFIPDGC